MKPMTNIVSFCLEQAQSQPAAVRIGLYRDLAEIAGTERERADLLSIANLLEDVERNHRQLVLDFKRRSLK